MTGHFYFYVKKHKIDEVEKDKGHQFHSVLNKLINGIFSFLN